MQNIDSGISNNFKTSYKKSFLLKCSTSFEHYEQYKD